MMPEGSGIVVHGCKMSRHCHESACAFTPRHRCACGGAILGDADPSTHPTAVDVRAIKQPRGRDKVPA
jgi:hypothetical protein